MATPQPSVATPQPSVATNVGQAETSISQLKTSIKIFDYWRTSIRQQRIFAEITEDELEADGLMLLIRDFADFLANTRMPRYWTGDCPLEDASFSRGVKAPETMAACLGKVKEGLKRQFPRHEDWKIETDWFANLREQVLKKNKRDELVTDDNSMGTKVRPLYKSNKPESSSFGIAAVPFDRDPASMSWIIRNDLEAICFRLLREKGQRNAAIKENPLAIRSMLIRLYHCVGRGGEVKFQRYSEAFWDPRYELVDTTWKELKNLTSYSMSLVPDMHSYKCCILHSDACYWLIENGLWRDNNLMVSGRGDFMYPDLLQVRDRGVARKLTEVIRACLVLDEGVPVSERNSFSCTSLRRAAITELSVHRDVGLFEATGRTGHSTQTNLDSYIDKMCFARSLPGGIVLAGWKSTNILPRPPTFACLPAHFQEQCRNLVKNLFVVSLPAFEEPGALYPWKVAAAASLIMYYNDLKRDVGSGNPVIQKIDKVARDIGLEDTTGVNGGNHVIVLEYMSKKIQESYRQQNSVLSGVSNFHAESIVQNQHALSTEVREVKEQVASILTDLASVNNKVTQGNSALATLASLERKLSSLDDRTRNIFRSPQRRQKRVREEDDEFGQGEARSTTSSSVNKSPQGNSILYAVDGSNDEASEVGFLEQPLVPEMTPDQPNAASFGTSTLATVTTSTGPSDDFKLSDIVLFYHSTKQFTTTTLQFSSFSPPAGITEKAKFSKCLALLDLVFTEDHARVLANTEVTNEKILQLAADIENLAMQKLLLLEEKDSRTRAKPLYKGVGRRVAAVCTKQNVKSLEELGIGVQVPGTPPGNRSIADYYGRRST